MWLRLSVGPIADLRSDHVDDADSRWDGISVSDSSVSVGGRRGKQSAIRNIDWGGGGDGNIVPGRGGFLSAVCTLHSYIRYTATSMDPFLRVCARPGREVCVLHPLSCTGIRLRQTVHRYFFILFLFSISLLASGDLNEITASLAEASIEMEKRQIHCRRKGLRSHKTHAQEN